jgi:ComF family protein
MFFTKIYQLLSDYADTILSPPYCSFCRNFLPKRMVFCSQCIRLLQPVVSTTLSITRRYTVTIHAIAQYKEPLRSLIVAKHSGDRSASSQLGTLMASLLPQAAFDGDCLVPVPLHWMRYTQRGFNQAEVIASVISATLQKPVESLLKRSRHTSFQAQLSAQERSSNVHEAFDLTRRAPFYEGKDIILVDDLMTTGATLYAAAKALTYIQPRSITAIVAARTL